jgi:7-cyano-7-deazaguanine synthase in queuosine biosynthesis
MEKVKVINTGTADNIHTKPNENLAVLAGASQILQEQRGYVVRMPEPGEHVVACLSGGLDSVSNIGILENEFGLKVHPFFVNRHQSNYLWEKRSVDFYDQWFSENFPDQHYPALEVELDTPAPSYKDKGRKVRLMEDDALRRIRIAYPARNPVMFMTGAEYGYSLLADGIEVKTLFAASHRDDFIFHSSLTALRLLNLSVCQMMDEWDWQVISLPIETEFGNYYGKDVLTAYSHFELGLPLEHTRSCCDKDEIQCGRCALACVDRRLGFAKLGIEDNTPYRYPMPREALEKAGELKQHE